MNYAIAIYYLKIIQKYRRYNSQPAIALSPNCLILFR